MLFSKFIVQKMGNVFTPAHKIGNFCIRISLKIEDCNVESLTTQFHLIFGYVQYIHQEEELQVSGSPPKYHQSYFLKMAN
jgi:hypothetical protein